MKELRQEYGNVEYGLTRAGNGYPPLHCTGKIAEVIDEKGVGTAPLRKRVRNALKIKGLDQEAGLREVGARTEAFGENGVGKPQLMLAQIYGFCKSKWKKGAIFFAG